MDDARMLVIGLGEVGRPLYEVFAEADGSVQGIDVEPVPARGPVDLMHVCYPFHVPGGFVETTAAYAEKYAPEILVVHSTVQPGTTRAVARASGRPAVYSPVRGKHTRMRAELRKYVKFLAGEDVAATRTVEARLHAAGMKTETMAPVEALELAKLLETSYFALLIAWAQETNRFAEELDAEYADVVRFFAEVDYLPRHVFVPGFIAGHCVMPNIALLRKIFSSGILDAIEESNERRGRELGGDRAKLEERLAPIPRSEG